MSKVSFEDFLIEGLVQEGSWGKVFAAKRISDGLPLALVRTTTPQYLILVSEILWLHQKSP
jgi:hypothetical protein